MHELEFARAAAPEPAVCLFLPLKPYSIGHELELWRQDNPLLTGTRGEYDALPPKARVEWLIRAVDHCSQGRLEYAASEKTLAATSASPWRQRREKRKLDKKWDEWSALINKLDEKELAAQVTVFRNYLALGRQPPPFPEERIYKLASGRTDDTAGRANGAPLLPRLMNFIAERPAYLADEDCACIHDFKFGQALWLYFTNAEIAGQSAIENEAERKIAEQEGQLYKEIAEEKTAAETAWKTADTDEKKDAALAAHPRIRDMFPAEIDAWIAGVKGME